LTDAGSLALELGHGKLASRHAAETISFSSHTGPQYSKSRFLEAIMRKNSAMWLVCALSFAITASAQSPEQYQKAANEALHSQLSQEGKDCLNARNNVDDKICINQVAQQTDRDFETFYQNLKQLLDRTAQTSLEQAQQEWMVYRDRSCDAVDQFFRDGTARVGMVARCEIQLERSRMKDLDAIYSLPLHH
jgi:uncharacterized protein YecT (DUF1311 family)